MAGAASPGEHDGRDVANQHHGDSGGNGDGVLLYYKYVALEHGTCEALAAWYARGCTALGLRGRVRVALDGVNVTVRAGVLLCVRNAQCVRVCGCATQ